MAAQVHFLKAQPLETKAALKNLQA